MVEKATFNLENALIAEGYDFVIGIDEAGRGPLAGPVVACAACLKNPHPALRATSSSGEKDIMKWTFVRDSKTLSHKQREELFDFVHENFHVGVGICGHKTIDRVNILEATYLAMKSALSDLRGKINYKDQRHIIVVDGNKKIPNLSLEQKAIVNGDKFVKSISAASIIAKVTRDRIMLEMHVKYPEYDFAKHKGYGTKLHMENLQKYGFCQIHRKSFAPVKDLIKKQVV
jgi:ribonuclease HII